MTCKISAYIISAINQISPQCWTKAGLMSCFSEALHCFGLNSVDLSQHICYNHGLVIPEYLFRSVYFHQSLSDKGESWLYVREKANHGGLIRPSRWALWRVITLIDSCFVRSTEHNKSPQHLWRWNAFRSFNIMTALQTGIVTRDLFSLSVFFPLFLLGFNPHQHLSSSPMSPFFLSWPSSFSFVLFCLPYLLLTFSPFSFPTPPLPPSWFPQLLVRGMLRWLTVAEMDEVSAQHRPSSVLTVHPIWLSGTTKSGDRYTLWCLCCKLLRTAQVDHQGCNKVLGLVLERGVQHWVRVNGL